MSVRYTVASPEFPAADTRAVLTPDCQRCPALVEARERISWGNGPPTADLLVVGEAPGAGNPDAERWQGGNWTGMAYTSRHSGRRIRTMLAEAGFAGDCYFTNAVKCFPADGEGSNREPTVTERANCRPYLRTEIEDIAPAAVVTTGKHATASVLAMVDRELDGFLEWVLDPVELTALETTLVPLLHPSYQNIWIPRLDHTRESYRAAIRTTLSEAVD